MSDLTRIGRTAEWLKSFLLIWSVGVGLLGAFASAIWAVAKDDLEQYARSVLRLDELATREQIVELQHDIQRLSGEDRVIRTRPAQSYVLEPVTQGDFVRVQYMIQRTERGENCIVEDGNAVFRDVRDIGFPGRIITPLQQFGREWRRARTVIEPPEELIPGRIEITIDLRYDCEGVTVFDSTEAVVYILRPAEQ